MYNIGVKNTLNNIYRLLLTEFGNRHWWPGDTQDEIIIGAILTQNVSWRNVKKAIDNLKREGLLSLMRITVKVGHLSGQSRPPVKYASSEVQYLG